MLLVEDDAQDAARLVAELERTVGPVAATCVDTAAAFRDRLASASWDAIIAEHWLPEFSAPAALELLQETGRDVPFVVVSASLSVEDAVAAMRLGAHDWVRKGELSRLGPLVQRELRDAEVRRELRESERARAQERVERELVAKQLEFVRSFGNDILLIVSLDGRIVEANDRAVEAYGYPIDALLRMNVEELRGEEDGGGFAIQLQAAQSPGGIRFTTSHRRRSGERFPVAVSARPIEVAGQLLVQSAIRDLTEEQAARTAIEREALLLEHLHDAVIGLDPELRVNAWNRAAERLFGVPREEAVGSALAVLVETQLPGGRTIEDFAREAERSGSARVEARYRTRAGTWIHGDARAVAVRDAAGTMIGWVVVVRDVTLHKRAEEALRASQERLTRVLETSSEAIWIIDREGRTEFLNRRAAELFGIAERDAVGRLFHELLPEPSRSRAREDLAEVQRGEEVRREVALARPDGTTAHLVFSRTVLRAPDGRITGGVAMFVDVTPQRKAWEELVQAQKMEAVGRLASGVAHDFNNLLVAILSNSAFLTESLPEDDPRRQDAAEIHDAGERAARLVRQLLAFARRSVVAPVPTDLNVVIGGFEKLLRRTIGEDVRVEDRLAEGLWPTRIDPGNVEQIIMNLGVNARDAMPGGGTLRLETRNEEVAPGAGEGLAPGRWVVLVVEDTGTGIPPEVLPHVFEPFFTTKRAGQGTGLGLSTVQGIVEQAHGRVAVSSTPGRGTRFTLHLPACDEAPAAVSGPTADAARGNGERILLVEDDDAVRESVRRVLARSGYAVLEATSGRDALARLAEDPRVALVLSDAVMPEGSGPALAEAIRAGPRRVPVVLMSGYPDRDCGAEPVIAKPFTPGALLVAVRRALERASPAPR